MAFILLIISCKKENKAPIDRLLTSIKAGQTDGPGIRYMDIVPDDTLLIENFPDNLFVTRNIDLDNDKIPDFELKYERSSPLMMGSSGVSLEIIPLGTNSVCISKTNANLVDSLSYNSIISDTNNWSNSKATLWSNGSFMDGSKTYYGYWYKYDHIYIGVKIIKDDKQFFGWIDMKANVFRRYAVTVPY